MPGSGGIAANTHRFSGAYSQKPEQISGCGFEAERQKNVADFSVNFAKIYK